MATLLFLGDLPCLPDGSIAVSAALVGVLSSDDVAVQRREIQKLLTQGHAVILDVANLRIRHDSAVKVFQCTPGCRRMALRAARRRQT
jgi:hypothetical protein